MTPRRLLIDGPAAIVDVTTAAVLWLDDQLTWALTLVWYAYWIVVATVVALCYVAMVVTLLAYWLGVPGALGDPERRVPTVLPRGPRA